MARELGLNPKKFGSLANHKQEPWKLPLPQYIEELYEKQFGRLLPSDTPSLEKKDADKTKARYGVPPPVIYEVGTVICAIGVRH